MRNEPPIDRAHLMATLRHVYGLAIEELAFMPVGFAAVCYTAFAADETKYFLKLWPDTRPASRAAERHAATLNLCRALYERNLFTRLPVPLRSRDGKLAARFGNATLAMFSFLPGSEPPTELPAELQAEWARTIARIHRATPALQDVLPDRETFGVPFVTGLQRALARLEAIGPHQRPGLGELRDLLLPRRSEIEEQLARLRVLRSAARRLPGPFVLCHTDAGGENMLFDGERLFVVDWDDATLAPPEHDLHEARFMDFARVLEVYSAAGGTRPLQLDHFAFYLLRRHLGDMTERVLRMLRADASVAEDQHALEGIQAWGFDQWRTLDQTLGGIREVLGRNSKRAP